MKELKELLKLYKISRINHSVVHNILIEYDKKEFDKYEIDLAYNKLNDEYYIFIIIEKSNKLIFKGLYKHDLKVLDNTYNAYNTRHSNMNGKLPIGPICNPSESSIKAAIYPEETKYYYFVSDKTGKAYFSKNYTEHQNIINKLKKDGLWYTYDK